MKVNNMENIVSTIFIRNQTKNDIECTDNAFMKILTDKE